MKFAVHLSAHLTPEWHSQYIKYEEMKSILYSLEQKIPADDIPQVREKYVFRSDEQFLRYCSKELNKINMFYAEKIAEAKRKLELLKDDLQTINQQFDSAGKNKRRYQRKFSELKMAFSELYLFLILIQNYQTLNYTGFRKILKKHDKIFQNSSGEKWKQENVENAPFYSNKDVDFMISNVETIFIDQLEGGNRHRAMKRLRVPPLDEKQSPVTTFNVGLLLGMLSVLLPLCFIISNLLFTNDAVVPWRPVFYLYRSLFLIILQIILVGVNVYGWSAAGVNHVLIFEIDPRNHLTYQQIIQIGALLAVLFALSFCCFIVSYRYDFYPFVHPLGFMIFIFFFLFNPTPAFYRNARVWLLKVLGRLFTAPFHYVTFADFWVGDQLTSLVFPFVDIYYFLCFYTTSYDWSTHTWNEGECKASLSVVVVLSSLPSLFRFLQCIRRYFDSKLIFPHLYNAVKYASTFIVSFSNVVYTVKSKAYPNSLRNPFLYMYIICALLESGYKCFWDLKVDWGFFDKNYGDNKFLREHIVYSSKWYYYTAIFENIVLRCNWMLSLYFTLSHRHEYVETYKFFAAVAEVIRRHVWNYFRLENEHLNNCGMFRAVRDISIVPIKPSESAWLEHLMDEEDGVTNRRRNKVGDSKPSSFIKRLQNLDVVKKI